jgi:hypothetical protein
MDIERLIQESDPAKGLKIEAPQFDARARRLWHGASELAIAGTIGAVVVVLAVIGFSIGAGHRAKTLPSLPTSPEIVVSGAPGPAVLAQARRACNRPTPNYVHPRVQGDPVLTASAGTYTAALYAVRDGGVASCISSPKGNTQISWDPRMPVGSETTTGPGGVVLVPHPGPNMLGLPWLYGGGLARGFPGPQVPMRSAQHATIDRVVRGTRLNIARELKLRYSKYRGRLTYREFMQIRTDRLRLARRNLAFLTAYPAAYRHGDIEDVFGQVGSHVRAITLRFDVGPTVVAKIQGGFYFAWWPSEYLPAWVTITTDSGMTLTSRFVPGCRTESGCLIALPPLRN